MQTKGYSRLPSNFEGSNSLKITPLLVVLREGPKQAFLKKSDVTQDSATYVGINISCWSSVFNVAFFIYKGIGWNPDRCASITYALGKKIFV